MTAAAVADELVVVRSQLGERAAFAELVERWHHPVWSFVHWMIRDPARSDDLTQEIWLRVVRGLPQLAAPDRFPAWVFTLARRVVYDELRQSHRQVDTAPLTAAEATGVGHRANTTPPCGPSASRRRQMRSAQRPRSSLAAPTARRARRRPSPSASPSSSGWNAHSSTGPGSCLR